MKKDLSLFRYLPYVWGGLLLILITGWSCRLYARQHTAITASQYTEGEINGYWQYLPPGYASSSDNYPLIIYLHGNSGRGNGSSAALEVMLQTGLTRVIDLHGDLAFTSNGTTSRFIVLSPQKNNQDANWNSRDIAAFLQYAAASYRTDPDKVYLVGYSMGGRGVYSFLSDENLPAETPAVTAAAVVAGALGTESACAIAGRRIPLLHYHSIHDNTATVTYELATSLLQSIQQCNTPYDPQLVSLDEDINRTDIDHDASDTISFNPDNGSRDLPNLYKWLLKYERSGDEVIILNSPPEVYAGEDIRTSLPADSIILQGMAEDSDGSITSVEWQQIQGTSLHLEGANSTSAILRNLRPGTYRFRLVATDNRDEQGSDEVLILIDAIVNGIEDQLREATIGPNPFTHAIQVVIDSRLAAPGQIDVKCYDMKGGAYPVSVQYTSSQNGRAVLQVIPEVPPGSYILRLIAEGYQRSLRVIKR